MGYSILLKNGPKRPRFSGKIKYKVSKIILSLILTLTQILTLKTFFSFFEIFDRNDSNFEVDHVWTMKGPSFTNVKEERMTKERPPGPEGYPRPPPPPSPVISKDPFQVI